MERLPELVRSAGIPVTLSVTPVAVPRLLQLTAYRIVQEALSNVVQHAAASRAAVAVRVDGGALVVDVVDDGAARPSVQPGYGLSGMRERAALVGGTLSAGPDPGGGFRVHAELPLEAP
ncbi:MAG: hypothetical protein HOY71_27215 [Nonomuraea sp.]|nr:hypothetical protein [Nonomuraea sp.]